MTSHTIADAEHQRLAALYRYDVLDSPPDPAFDAIVQLAARICSAPIALISLVDEARQWFKARLNLELTETSRDISFCSHAIEGRALFVVPDALGDARFCNFPFVKDRPNFRFYAGMPIVTSDGYALGTLCVIDKAPRNKLTDHETECLHLLSREVMAQLELRRALKECSDVKRTVEDMNVELEAFTSAVAHDLRAPLRHIGAFANLLSEECSDIPKATERASRIEDACGRACDIIDALLRLSRAAHSSLHITTVDASAMVREIADELRSLEPHRNVEFVVAEGVKAQADRQLLHLVLTNLLSNSWKFTRQRPQGRIEFGQRCDGERREFFVRDNGIGFDPDHAPLPAKPFVRQHGVNVYEGLGLGLTIVERIVRRHSGAIAVHGVADGGAMFVFTLGSVAASGGSKLACEVAPAVDSRYAVSGPDHH